MHSRMNSRTVRPLEVRAMNDPTNGDHAIHQASQTLSVVSGLKRRVRRLSEFNGVLAILLVSAVLLLGSTLFCSTPSPTTSGAI